MTPHQLIGLAIEVAEEGLAAGELPIGAVVAMGDEIVGRAYTQERALNRRLVHADLLAMIEADQRLGWRKRPEPLVLAVTLEPCLMCLGAAMAMGVQEVSYGLESPSDGAGQVGTVWKPPQPGEEFAQVPTIAGGILRQQCRNLFARYAESAESARNPGMRRWASGLAGLPDQSSGEGRPVGRRVV
ncbi:nucleoside deaminase [Streptomyces sp. NL15-2K]|uniref:nucleoside deaminase n=1 Tax=Streptomyces sp. NL15-2K TaxID=376149 RepID=UPI000F55CF2F|nr:MULTISPECIES: deaminase [Actinomycetes]WKX11203.1 deaminase [Kutzneria buriramensis]GCB47384.1 tRNA-specific adenosine-34 deaminase [Streptomyces sp. NL15-2K]